MVLIKQCDKNVRFCKDLEMVLYKTSQRMGIPTKDFMADIRETNRINTDEVNFTEVQPAIPGQTFKEAWSELENEYQKYVRPADINIFKGLLAFRDMLRDESHLLDRIEDLSQSGFFATFIDLYTFVTRVEDCKVPNGFTVLARQGKWSMVKDIITVFEDEWAKHETSEFEMEKNKESFAGLQGDWFDEIINDSRNTEFQAEHFAASKEEFRKKKECVKDDFLTRWRKFKSFIASPVETYNEYRKRLVEFYFKMFDSGIIYSMINDVQPEGESVAKNLVLWKVPESLRLMDTFRVFFPPLVCADRLFSCRHELSEHPPFPEYETLEEAERVNPATIPGLTCRQHPGKLLLLLIRLDLKDMVKFAIENGMPVNNSTDSGHCTSLRWNTDTMPTSKKSRYEVNGDRAGISDMEIANANKSAAKFFSALQQGVTKDLLQAEFAQTTPLSVAIENAVYGASLDIVEVLLESKANPLFCSDAAIKSCVNALDLLTRDSHKDNNNYKTIPYLDDMNVPCPPTNVNKIVDANDIPVLQRKLSKKMSIKRESSAGRQESKVSVGSHAMPTVEEPAQKPRKRSGVDDRIKAYKDSTMKRRNFAKKLSAPERVDVQKAIQKRRSLKLEQKVADPVGDEESNKNSAPKALSRRRKFATQNLATKISVEETVAVQKAIQQRRSLKLEQQGEAIEPEVSPRKAAHRLKSGNTLRRALKPIPSTSSIKSAGGTTQKKTKEKVAFQRAKVCCRRVTDLVKSFRKVRDHHCTRVWLYQACVEKRIHVVQYLLETKREEPVDGHPLKTFLDLHNESNDTESVTSTSNRTEVSKLEAKLPDLEAFELMMSVIDLLLNDGLQKLYPTYAVVLEPVLDFLQQYDLYLNNWRFMQLFRLIKLAMRENLAGDRRCILQFMKLPQMLHFLGVKPNASWESRRLENLPLTDLLRAKLRIESKTQMTPSQLTRITGRDTEVSQLDHAQAVELGANYKNTMDRVEKLLKLATKMEALEIVAELVKLPVMPSNITKFHMIAISVKAQNTDLFGFLYKTYGQESLLNKAFVIALKGKYHQSMQKVFDLGFRISLRKNLRVRSDESVASRFANPVIIGAGRRGRTIDGKNRQTLSLFGRCLEDVLFERTVFDRDHGRRNKEGFTRQDEETTFTLLVNFLVDKIPLEFMSKMLEKIVQRSIKEYDSRIWFYGFHDILILVAQKEKFELITDAFIEVYGLNYIQWLLYTRELKKKFEDQRRAQELKALRGKRRKGRRNWKRGNGAEEGGAADRRSSLLTDSSSENGNEDSTDPNSLDTEVFLNIATSKIDRTLGELLAKEVNSPRIRALRVEIERVRDLVKDAEVLERTPRTLVQPLCRRNGSRNYDYLVTHTMANGASEML